MSSAQPATAPQLVPLRRSAHLALNVPANQAWIEQLVWQPIAYSELHLCSHYYPIAIRLVRSEPLLGVLLGREFQVRPLVDERGIWQSGYLPMAVRSFPFQSTGRSEDPLDDLVVPAQTPWLGPEGSIRIREPNGRLSPHLINLHMLCRRLAESRQSMAAVLDLLMVADLLSPVLSGAGGSRQETPFLTVDRNRMASVSRSALAAMARHRFAAIDIMVASVFSQAQLRATCRPAPSPERAPQASTETRRSHGLPPLPLDDIVVDDGELLSYADLEAAMATLPRSAPPGTGIAPSARASPGSSGPAAAR
jgi:hypothetical protein